MIVDVHHHWMPRRHLEEIRGFLRPGEDVVVGDGVVTITRGGVAVSTIDREHSTRMERQLEEMDAHGVDVALLSAGIWQEWLTLEAAREMNDEAAAIQRRHPTRFAALAQVPPFADGAADELDRALGPLGLRGIGLTTHWEGRYLDDPGYRPVYETAVRHDVPIVIHASSLCAGCGAMDAHGLLPILGRIVDLSAAVGRLLASPLIAEVPTLKIVAGHLGGFLWAFMGRWRRLGAGPNPVRRIGFDKKLKQVWFDIAPPHWTPAELACARDGLGADRLLFGTDFPVRAHWMREAREMVERAGIPSEDRERILGNNAAPLFKIGQ